MRKLQIDIDISAERYVALYNGQAKTVYAMSRQGVSVQFPGKILNQFVTHDGICGTFEIVFDGNNKLVNIKKIV